MYRRAETSETREQEMSPLGGRNRQCRCVFGHSSQTKWGNTKCSLTHSLTHSHTHTTLNKMCTGTRVLAAMKQTQVNIPTQDRQPNSVCVSHVQVLISCLLNTLGIHVVELKKVRDHGVDVGFGRVLTQHLPPLLLSNR